MKRIEVNFTFFLGGGKFYICHLLKCKSNQKNKKFLVSTHCFYVQLMQVYWVFANKFETSSSKNLVLKCRSSSEVIYIVNSQYYFYFLIDSIAIRKYSNSSTPKFLRLNKQLIILYKFSSFCVNCL